MEFSDDIRFLITRDKTSFILFTRCMIVVFIKLEKDQAILVSQSHKNFSQHFKDLREWKSCIFYLKLITLGIEKIFIFINNNVSLVSVSCRKTESLRIFSGCG